VSGVVAPPRPTGRPMLCGQCARQTYWDDEVGSAICTTCGTLVDPSQSVLTSHLDQHDNSARQYNIFPSSTTPLKSVHGHQGWNLAGQGKEARDVKNNVCVLLSSFFYAPLTSLLFSLPYTPSSDPSLLASLHRVLQHVRQPCFLRQ